MKNSQNEGRKHPLHHYALEFAEFANGTRGDFHDPDNQGIEFKECIGCLLNNAMGTDIMENPELQEVIVYLKRPSVMGIGTWAFNLANIFALAKIGAGHILVNDGYLNVWEEK